MRASKPCLVSCCMEDCMVKLSLGRFVATTRRLHSVFLCWGACSTNGMMLRNSQARESAVLSDKGVVSP